MIHSNDEMLAKSLKTSFWRLLIVNKYWEDIHDIRCNEKSQHPESVATRGKKEFMEMLTRLNCGWWNYK